MINYFKAFLRKSLEEGGSENEILIDRITTLTGETITTGDLADFGRGVLTIDPDGDGRTTTPEHISFSGVDPDGPKLTGAVRGLSAKGFDVIENNKKFHPVGTPVIMSFGVHNLKDMQTFFESIINSALVNPTALIVPGTAGESVVQGNLLYLKDDGKWWKTDATNLSTIDGTILAFSMGEAGTDELIDGGVMIKGLNSSPPTNLVAGDTYFVSDTPGGISNTPGTNERSIGIARSPSNLYFDSLVGGLPSAGEKAALGGAQGVPSGDNRFLTEDQIFQDVDQEQTTQNSNSAVGQDDSTGNRNQLAQSFIPTKTKIRGVKLFKLEDIGSFTGDVNVALQADDDGDPSGTDLASVTISNSDWDDLEDDQPFQAIFSSEYHDLVVGDTYWIVISTSTASNTNHPSIGVNTAGGYDNGKAVFSNSADGWVDITGTDLYFRTLEGKSGQIPKLASPILRVYTTGGSPHTWTKPDNLSHIIVEVVGGGGGGRSVGVNSSGAGGGAGGYSKKLIHANELNTEEEVVVGTGGGAETSGDSSSFGTHCSATGGSGAAAAGSGHGASGGSGSGGDLNIGGGDGGSRGGTSTGGQTGGNGGSSPLGGGGAGGHGSNNPGSSGRPFGGGGGGGANATPSGGASGGSGAGGVVMVHEYYA